MYSRIAFASSTLVTSVARCNLLPSQDGEAELVKGDAAEGLILTRQVLRVGVLCALPHSIR